MVEKENIPEVEGFTPEQYKGWEDYRLALLLQKTKSDDLFEKAITFISSGALALTLTFHDKIVPVDQAIYIILIGIGWALLIGTLFINLISHYQSSKSIDKSIDDVDDILENKITYSIFREKIEKRNKCINTLNIASIYLLGAGLILIIIYTTINIHYGKEKQSDNNIEFTKRAIELNKESGPQRSDDTTSVLEIKQ